MGAIDMKTIGYIWGVVIVGAIIAFVVKSKQLKLKESGMAEVEHKRKVHRDYIRFSNHVLTRKRFRRIVMQFATLGCYDAEQVKEESIKLFKKATLSSIAMPLIALVLFQHIVLAGLVALIGLVYYNMTVDTKIDKLYEKIIGESAMCVQSIHDCYVTYRSIPKAVLECDRGQYLDKAIDKIYDILTDIDGADKLYDFKKTTPVRLIGTLATVCYVMNNQGDTSADATKASAFESVMTAMRREADTEVRKLQKTRLAFSSLTGLSLVGLIASPFLDIFLLNAIPGVSLYLKGMYGAIEKTLIIGITLLSYYLISTLTRPTVVNQVDIIEWVDNLSQVKWVRNFIMTIIPKKYKEVRKWKKLLNESISSKTPLYIYTLKVVSSIGAFIGMSLVIAGFVLTAKYNLWTNTGSLSIMESTQEMTPRLQKQLEKLDYEYMTSPTKPDEETTLGMVYARLAGIGDIDAMNHVSRLSTKWDTYYGLGFKWYHILIAYLAAVAAWFTPELSLMLRKKLVTYEAIEDVMQLQTVMIALSNTKMGVPEVLYWLASESTVHKAPLHYAQLEYSSDPELALARLKDSVQSKDLKRMVSKLEMAVYSLSMGDAFNDILLDKEQSLVMSEMLQNETIESKKQYAKLISGLPTSIAVMGGFVVPILILGVVQLMTSLSDMGS